MHGPINTKPLDPSKGAKLSSRIPCDGATNPQDQINLTPTFSAGGLERSFRIDVFEDKYCKRMDLGFACLTPRHSFWKQEFSVDSSIRKPVVMGWIPVMSWVRRMHRNTSLGLVPGRRTRFEIALETGHGEADYLPLGSLRVYRPERRHGAGGNQSLVIGKLKRADWQSAAG